LISVGNMRLVPSDLGRIQNAARCLLTDTTTFIQHPVDRCHTDTGMSGYILKRCFA
jgi:hypothetical protein